MHQGINQAPLLPTDINHSKAIQLANLLEKYAFPDTLGNALSALKTQLENNQITAENYFNNTSVKTALDQLSHSNQWLIPALYRIWKNHNHDFTRYEKIGFTFSLLTLITSALFSREINVMMLDGKPELKATGMALMDYCNPLGLTTVVANTCGLLEENATAVFDMNRKTKVIPTYSGNISDPINGPIPSTSLQEIPSWIDPLGWITFFVCSNVSSVTRFVGHFFVDSLTSAREKAKSGFPILSMIYDPASQAFPPVDLNATAFLFLTAFCISVKEGGYSTIPNLQGQVYGHFDGFERTGDSFERNAYLFAGVYAGLTALAFLTISALLLNKIASKWTNSAPEREKFYLARQAHALIKTVAINAETPPSSETSASSLHRI